MAFPGREVSPPVEHAHIQRLTTRIAEQQVKIDVLKSDMESLKNQVAMLEVFVRELVGVDKPSGP